MKILKTLGILLTALCLPCMSQAQITIQEAKTLIKEGKAKKLPEYKIFRDCTDSGIKIPNASDALVGTVKTDKKDSSSEEGLIKQSFKVPSKVTNGGSEVYGFCRYSEDETVMPVGLYYIEPNGLLPMWEDEFYYTEFYTLNNGFLYNGSLIGTATYAFMGYMFGYSRLVIDFETGRIISRTDYDFQNPDVITYELIAYNTNDGCVYGTARANDGKYHWYRTSMEDLGSGDDLGVTSPDITSLCYNEIDNAFYGTDLNGYFVKIDLEGNCTQLFKLDASDINFKSMASLVYCPVEKLYYTNLRSTGYGYMMAIDAEKKEIVSKDRMPVKAQFSVMVTTDEVVENPMKPLAPQIKSLTFEDGSTTGYGDFVMPSISVSDQPLAGEILAYPSVNGVMVAPEGILSAPGETLRVDFTDLPEGRNTFKMFVRYDGISSRTATETVYLGNDVPLAPKNVQINDSLVRWSAVRKGVNDAFLARNELRYKVYVNDDYIGETENTRMPISLPKDKEYALYTAKVIAVCRGKESEPAFSSGLASGAPFNLPLYIIPTEEQSNLCSISNSNMDEAMWWYNDYYDAFVMGYNDYRKSDDWVIMPPFEVKDTEKYYQLSFEIARASQKYTEEFLSVYTGTSNKPESMTNEIMAPFSPINYGTTYDKYIIPFKVGVDGGCHVGFHCTSDAGQYGMRLKNIFIVDNNITDESPAQVLNLDIQPYEAGELKADISFNLPRKTLFGEQLPKDVEVSAIIMGVDTITVSGRPGERMKAVIPTHQGRNVISVMTKLGDLGSVETEATVVTGVMQPETPVVNGLTIAPDMQSMTMTWKPVTTGMEGGYVVPEDITYVIYQQKQTVLGADYWDEIANVGTATSYTFVCEPGAPLDLVTIGVASFNAAGTNGYVSAGQGQVGTPYTVPMEEDFSKGYINLNPWLILDPNPSYSAEYEVMETVEVGNFDTDAEYLMIGQGEKGSKGRLAVPRFTSMDLQNANISMTVYTGAKAAPMTIYAGYQGAQKLLVMGNIEANPEGPEFSTVTFNIPEQAMGHYWVQIYIDSEFKEEDQLFMMQNISVQPGEYTAVSTLEEEKVKVSGVTGQIIVKGCESKQVSITSADGMVFANETVTSNVKTYPLAKGIYVVTAGSKSFKIAVK